MKQTNLEKAIARQMDLIFLSANINSAYQS